MWPPSSKDATLFVDSSFNPHYPSYTGSPSSFPNAGPLLPPNSALCSSASSAMSFIFQTCNIGSYTDFVHKTSNTTIFSSMTPQCRDGMRITLMFAIVLQFEFLIGGKFIDVGSTYFESLTKVDAAISGVHPNFAPFTLSSTEYVRMATGSWAGTVVPVLTGVTYAGHVSIVSDDTLKTSYPANTVSLIPANTPENPFIGNMYGGYPVHFEICQASIRMYDYLAQVPANLVPDTYGAYTHPARCTTNGAEHLKFQSDVLGIEKAVTATGASSAEIAAHCPTVTWMKEKSLEASQAIRSLSPAFIGEPCHMAPGGTAARVFRSEIVCAQASPKTADAMYLHGADAYYARSLWLTFLVAHVTPIAAKCNVEYAVGDPFGYTNVDVSIAQVTALKTTYDAEYPSGTLPPSLSAAEIAALTPVTKTKAWRDEAWPADLTCTDDPTLRIRGYLGLQALTGAEFLGAVNPQLAVAFNTAPGTETLCFLCALPCEALGPKFVDPDVHCVMADVFQQSCSSCFVTYPNSTFTFTTPDC